jgi:DNA polymerase I-like protein with 3'-5' exonuclease and polymerase domains
MDVLGVLLEMGTTGAPVDEPAMDDVISEMEEALVDVEGRIYAAAGKRFNLNSTPQKQDVLYLPKKEGGQGLKPWKLTDGGMKKKKSGQSLTHKDYSTDADSLERFTSNPVVEALLEYADVNKLKSYPQTYLGVEGDKDKPRRIFDGRVYADFVQYGTTTGRFSCVSGSTLLPTSRGLFRFDEYLPQDGDLVLTHKGNLKPVVRKIYKGVQPMYRVSLSSGSSIECTQEHRLLTRDGWRYVRDLNVGDRVIRYVGIEELYEQSRACSDGFGDLSRNGQAYAEGNGREMLNNVAQRGTHLVHSFGSGDISTREGSSLLSLEGRRAESYALQEWFPAPQLQGRNRSFRGISTGKSGRSLHKNSSSRGCGGLGIEGSSCSSSSSSYRWGQDEQQPGQSGFGHSVGSWEASCQEDTIREVAFVAAMGVWDIEVADDHSYVAQGFLNHNCREPNLQNIPRPDTDLGKRIRGLFIAPPGHKLIAADYGQIELVIFAHFADKGLLYEGFMNGVDPHTMTAAGALNKDPEDVTPDERQFYGKTLNFAITFGVGPDKVADMLKMKLPDAKEILAKHQRAFPEIYRLKSHIISTCRSRRPPYVKTLLGRKRRLPTIHASEMGPRMYAERQAVSSVIQGSAADLNKLAMIKTNASLPEDMQLILTVHDELVIICPEDRTDLGQEILREALLGEEIQKLIRVPLKADIKVVDKWSQAK